jgi:hypothetical protein
MPRAGLRGTTGDDHEIDYAYLEATPLAHHDVTLTAGKLDGVFGREYRIQESPDRFGVTPSLLFRYVGGHPVGVKVRARLLDRHLVAAAALTNGPSFAEIMPFADDVDKNDGKTGSGRLAAVFALPRGGFVDLGVSGEIGTQGRQTDPDVGHHQWGADLTLAIADLELWAEWIDGRAEGGGIDGADALEYTAFYGAVAYRALPWLGGHVRFERRDAVHANTDQFVYLIDIQRITAGLRLDLSAHVIAKVEVLVNQERGDLPVFANDVVTSSLIARF